MKSLYEETQYEKERRQKTHKKSYSWLFAVLLLTGVVIVVWNIDIGTKPEAILNVPIGRTPLTNLPATFDESLFSGRTKDAYVIAARIPQILAQIYCYCQCNMESLLICYTNEHAAGCDECQEEAFMARELLSKGFTIQQIQQEIHKRFGGKP